MTVIFRFKFFLIVLICSFSCFNFIFIKSSPHSRLLKHQLRSSTEYFYGSIEEKPNVIIESPSINSRKITAATIIAAPPETVWKILTSYNKLADYVPNLVKSYLVDSPSGSIRLYQEGAQKIIGFDFRASLVMVFTF